jgi:hypothetical protein
MKKLNSHDFKCGEKVKKKIRKIVGGTMTFKANSEPAHLWRTSCTTPPLPLPMTLMVSRSSNEKSKSTSLLSKGCTNR